MVKQLGPKTAIVSLKELGTNCWRACRFIKEDGRCHMVFTCSYPEKKTCQAVHAEISYLKAEQSRLARVSGNIDCTIERLAEMTEK